MEDKIYSEQDVKKLILLTVKELSNETEEWVNNEYFPWLVKKFNDGKV